LENAEVNGHGNAEGPTPNSATVWLESLRLLRPGDHPNHKGGTRETNTMLSYTKLTDTIA
jgi:hypothetical protein